MDSGNSGSMNSSSGDDQEYDSRAESIPSFMNNPSSHHHFNPLSSNPHLSSHHQNHPPSLFNPPSNYLEPFSSSQSPSSSSHLNPNSLSNLDVIWSRGLIGSSSGGGGGSQGVLPSSTTNTHQISFPSSSDGHGQGHALRGSPSTAGSTDQTTNVVNRNSKKRTRASRRAPTTVLTTDTSNFRAMVQEFTGIPAPPFSASSLPTYSRRFDLFGNSTTASALSSLGPLYPLRPSAHKVINNQQQNPFPSSSSPSLLNNSTTTNSITTSSMAAASPSFLNMQNPILTFQSLLQSPVPPPSSSLKYPLGDGAVFGTKSPLEELGMSTHGVHLNTNLSGFQSHGITSDGTALRSENNVTTTTTTNWRDGTAGNNNNNHHHHQDHLRPLINDDNFDHHRGISGFKLSASSSDFHHPEKGLENVSSRGEGAAVESWICPSD